MGHTRSHTPVPDGPEEVPFVGDLPTFDTRANTDVFHIAHDSPLLSRSPSPAPSVGPHRPWYNRPSPLWLLPLTIIGALLMAATIAPRQELYIRLVCNELRPEYILLPPPAVVSLGADIPNDPQTPIYIPPPAPPNRPAINIPGPNKMCTSDPGVLAASAKLQTALTTSMGVLSCLTTGSWAQLSDRIGRTRVLAIAALGILFTDAVLILVAFYADMLPGGYRFLIVGNIIDGALGGWTTSMAISHAYVSDTVAPAARSRTFSYFTGALFCGMAVGPTLGALVTQYTNDLLTVFYIGTGLHIFYAIFSIFIVPESLDLKARTTATELYKANQDPSATWFTHIKHTVSTFARPLVVFLPHKRPRGKGRDWSLTWVGISFASSMLNMGSYTFKFQYAIAQFGWGTTELGYWMTTMGASRAVHLLILLPLILRGLQRVYRGKRHTYVDLFVARLSLAMEFVGYIVMAITTNIPLFAITTCWMSFGGGFGPSVQSIALALSQDQAADKRTAGDSSTPEYDSTSKSATPSSPSENGTLFGALSVLQAISSQIVGPSLFGLVFVKTISSAPHAIFWTSAGCIIISLFALGMVGLKKEEAVRAEGLDEESPLI
ncbi:MFS transporter [Rhizoctonia solani AG-3 Rhs1AP]|uniref:MFS transporter n=1 Tax=Rhizoctonia solani AG-3 Rhs1AP TaxID=1086054 RepID=X8JDQ9_9AGAM|nr:MFS transporter [Rhizoctonia solani AG-3 Rhs1AP]